MPRRLNDPFVNFNFLVESAGLLAAGFSEITDDAETRAWIREGRTPTAIPQLPGLPKYGT